jgi:hypothetical protein
MFKQKLKALLNRTRTDLSRKTGDLPRISSFELTLPSGKNYSRQDRITLYRFLTENIPILNGAIWLWTRLCAAPIEFKFERLPDNMAKELVRDIDKILVPLSYQKEGGVESIINLFFRSLFIEGCFSGEVVLNSRKNSLVQFVPCDSRNLVFETDRHAWQIYYETDDGRIRCDPASFYFASLDSSANDPRGESLLTSIGFVSHLEQKLILDMSQTLEKSGYQRVQVKLARPERNPGESESKYIDRANSYFDDTVGLIKSLKPSDSAITWDDVQIQTIGPSGQGVASSWYLYHRSLVEDVCAGVHLDPFMLGYSFGTTQTWARFKYELIMRQIISVQEKARGFLKWLVGLEMALRGLPGEVDIIFDNRRVFGSLERYKAESLIAESIIEQYKAGLIDKQEAQDRLSRIEPGIV